MSRNASECPKMFSFLFKSKLPDFRYTNCNPTVFSSSDTCYVIAFSIILLNTSLHNPNVKEKPTEDRFIRMCAGIDGGNDLPASQLGSYFKSINKNPFKLPEEEDQAFGKS